MAQNAGEAANGNGTRLRVTTPVGQRGKRYYDVYVESEQKKREKKSRVKKKTRQQKPMVVVRLRPTRVYPDLPGSHGRAAGHGSSASFCLACPGWPTRHVSPLTARRDPQRARICMHACMQCSTGSTHALRVMSSEYRRWYIAYRPTNLLSSFRPERVVLDRSARCFSAVCQCRQRAYQAGAARCMALP
jgi:hypothetical protein